MTQQRPQPLSKKQVQLIRSLRHKKYRKLHGLFVVEGAKLVNEALESHWKVETVIGMQSHSALFTYNTTIYTATSVQMQQISQLQTPPPVLAVVQCLSPESIRPEQRLNLLLDGISDPGNMGALMRIADWYGIKAVFCTDDCVDLYNPKVVQASMGSIFRVQMEVVHQLDDWKSQFANMVWLGAAADQTPIRETALSGNMLLVIGSEAHGIRNSASGKVDQWVSIPRYGQAESLNAAVAAGILIDNITSRL